MSLGLISASFCCQAWLIFLKLRGEDLVEGEDAWAR